MTKVKDLTGGAQADKPIKFTHYCFSLDDGWDDEASCDVDSSNWENIELLARNWRNTGKDLMFAHDNNRSSGVLFLGYFNNGKVKEND